jgi:tRNA-2-methylthio-N6-dimethylallyladenosine synthase
MLIPMAKLLGNGLNFTALIKKIGKISGIERIRFTTSHPRDLSDELINCFAEEEKLCKHIHLPVQSGSNRILALMNRGYTVEEYMKKVDHLRKMNSSRLALPRTLLSDFREKHKMIIKKPLT